jgi:hypothetical protein
MRDGSPPSGELPGNPTGRPNQGGLDSESSGGTPPLKEPQLCPDWRSTEDYRRGYRVGVQEADLQFKAGRVTLYTYGLGTPLENIDRETGLPFEAISGCFVNDWIVGRAYGHMARVKELLKVHGDPPNSFKRWERELFDLRGFVRVRSLATKPLSVKAGGSPIVSPDGAVTVRPLRVETVWDSGHLRVERVSDSTNRWCMLALGIEAEGRHLGSVGVGAWDHEVVELFWGPEGSGFAVVRTNAGGSYELQAFSLKDGSLLRRERVNKHKS